MKRKAIGEQLLQKDIRPSFPRLRVMEYLLKNRNHPTVDEIYRELVQEMPTLSKTTVYNTLALFEEAGLVRRVTSSENEARYDAFIEDHGHFRCESCGVLYDFTIRLEKAEEEGLDNFEIRKRDILYQGLCPRCRNSGIKKLIIDKGGYR